MIYQEINESLTAHDVARWLGFDVKGNLMLCPFHADKNPSMYVYSNSFYCFSCNRYEDNIGMVASVKNISNWEAVKLINTAFSLGYSIESHNETEEEKLNRIMYKKSRQYEAELKYAQQEALETVAAVCRMYGRDGLDVSHIEELHDRLLIASASSARYFYPEVKRYEEILKGAEKC